MPSGASPWLGPLLWICGREWLSPGSSCPKAPGSSHSALSPGLSGQAWDLAGVGRDREGASLGALPPAACWATREGAS